MQKICDRAHSVLQPCGRNQFAVRCLADRAMDQRECFDENRFSSMEDTRGAFEAWRHVSGERCAHECPAAGYDGQSQAELHACDGWYYG